MFNKFNIENNDFIAENSCITHSFYIGLRIHLTYTLYNYNYHFILILLHPKDSNSTSNRTPQFFTFTLYFLDHLMLNIIIL